MPRAKKAPVAPTSSPALLRTLDVIGGKWTVPILHALLGGTRRFGQLQSALGGVSPKMLIARLRELEQQGFVTRTMYPEIPPRVEYALTDLGRTLKPIIDAMEAWGESYGDANEQHRTAQATRKAIEKENASCR